MGLSGNREREGCPERPFRGKPYGSAFDSLRPLVKERDKKHAPLPKLTASTLLIEVPELLEGTYLAQKQIGSFAISGSKPDQLLGLFTRLTD